jgi:hypothetical protein
MSSEPSGPRPAARWAAVHGARRAAFLARLTDALRADGRIVALWLFGSLGRGDGDALSDVDATAAVEDGAAAVLCARPWRSAGHTTPERLALLRRCGEVVLTHDVHANAPEGGTQTNAVYADGVSLDLNLVPLARARRPAETRLLFERRPVPAVPPAAETLAQRRHQIGQTVALFWIMTLVTAKYRLRGWDVSAQSTLTQLRGQVASVRRLIAGEAPRFRRLAPDVPLAATPEAQAAALRALADEMEALLPAARRLGADVPESARTQLGWWLDGA